MLIDKSWISFTYFIFVQIDMIHISILLGIQRNQEKNSRLIPIFYGYPRFSMSKMSIADNLRSRDYLESLSDKIILMQSSTVIPSTLFILSLFITKPSHIKCSLLGSFVCKKEALHGKIWCRRGRKKQILESCS